MEWIPALLIVPYLFFLLKIYSCLLKIRPFIVPKNPSLFVSIVIACRNEEKSLPLLLNRLALQTNPKELYEVIVVDDNSSDSTFSIAADFNRILNIRVFHNEGSGKKKAIRTGVVASSGNFILTTDADCLMSNNWIKTIASFYEKYNPDMIICPVQLEHTTRLPGNLQELEFLSLQGVTAGTVMAEKATMCNGANLAFTKEAYLSHYYDIHEELISGDDVFFLHSLKKDPDSKIMWLESADGTVTTAPSKGFSPFLNQRSRWISKIKAYSDKYTIKLTIVTSTAIFLQFATLLSGLIFPSVLKVFFTIVILKSVPDFLILANTCRRYNKSKLMLLFPIAQLLYPFYVISVIFTTYRNRQSEIRNSS